MAGETLSTSVDELAAIAIAEARMVAQNRQDLTKLLTPRMLKQNEISARFPKYSSQSAAALTQGSDATNSEVTTTGVVLTPDVNAVWSTMTTDLSVFNEQQFADYGRLAADAIIKKKNADTFALFDGFSVSLGTTNVDVTVALVKQGVKKLLQAGATGPIYFVFTPEVWEDFTADLITSGNASLVSDNMKDKILSGAIDQGFTLFGAIPVCATSGISEVGDVKCGLFTREALGYASKWDFKFEVQRRSKAVGWDITASAAYAVGEIDDAMGIELLVDGAD